MNVSNVTPPPGRVHAPGPITALKVSGSQASIMTTCCSPAACAGERDGDAAAACGAAAGCGCADELPVPPTGGATSAGAVGEGAGAGVRSAPSHARQTTAT